MARLVGIDVEGLLPSIMVETSTFVELDILPPGQLLQIDYLFYTGVCYQLFFASAKYIS
jgi:hypothetical protein